MICYVLCCVLCCVAYEGHSHMTLDIAQELLPLLKNLLESRFQIYAAVSLRYLIIILRAFTPLVKDTRASCGRRRVRDLAREDRLARCNAIYDCCASLRNLVPPIMEKHEAIAVAPFINILLFIFI